MFFKIKNLEIFVFVKCEMICDKLFFCDCLSLVFVGVLVCVYKCIIIVVNLLLWDVINDEVVIL